jgi:digeranylgeranylglycerophospholipid reductase
LLDVAVIGGGPVGSRIAHQLAILGHRVTVLERRPAIGQKPCCTGILSRQCLTNYAIPTEVVYRYLNSAVLFSPSMQSISVTTEQPQAAIVDRSAFDCWMSNKACQAGVDYLLNCLVTKIEPGNESISLEYRHHNSVHRLTSRTLVLANGFNSLLVSQIGLGRPAFLTSGVQTEVATSGLEQIQIYFDQKIAPGFFAWLAPTSPGRALAGLMSRDSPGKHLRYLIASLLEKGVITASVRNIKYGGIPMKPLKNTCLDRIIVVGDAAGQVKPTTGGGIYFGLQCADIGATALHQALTSGDYSRRVLSQYQRDWQTLLAAELKKEYWARRTYQLLSDRQIDLIFKTLIDNDIVNSLLKEEYTSFDHHGALLIKVLKQVLKSRKGKLIKTPGQI